MKDVTVVVGAGSIGQAIARRISSGRHVVLADLHLENAEKAAGKIGPLMSLVQAAGVSPSQAPVETILKVDLYGTAMLLEEFGQAVAKGGSGIVISS